MRVRRTGLLLAALAAAGCSGGGSGGGSVTPAVALGPAACTTRDGLPDAACTPGGADPRVTPDRIASTICRRGYAASVRPPRAVTNRIKIRVVHRYGLDGTPFAAIELDHLVPLSLGGASTERNLWPELRAGRRGAVAKDDVEVRLHDEVCRGRLGLRAAQQAIARDWSTVP